MIRLFKAHRLGHFSLRKCAEYWKLQGFDPLDAILTFGFRVTNPDTMGVVNGTDALGRLLFFGLIIAGCCFVKAEGML